MKKCLAHYKLLIITGVFLVLAFYLYDSRELLHELGNWNSFGFTNPRDAAVGAEGKIYVVDDEYKRITKIDASGTIDSVLHSKTMGRGGFYKIDNIETDSEGNLYVSHQIIDQIAKDIVEVQIIKYNPQGKYEGVLVRKATGNDYTYELSWSFHVVNNNLYYCTKNKKGMVTLWKKPVGGGPERALYDIDTSFEEFAWFELGENDHIYYTTYKGKLYLVGPEGQQQISLSQEDGSLKAPDYLVGFKDKVYMLDLDSSGIFYLDRANKLHEVVNKNKLRQWGYQENKIIFSNISLDDRGRIYTTDILNEKILRIDADKGQIMVIQGGGFDFYNRSIQTVFSLGLLAELLILLYFISLGILKIRRSVTAKQLVYFLGLLLLAITVFTVQIYTHVNKHYYQELQNRIMMAAQYGSGTISGDVFESINSLEQWNGPEFEKMEEYLEKSLYSAKYQWNNDLYAAAYKVRDGNFYLDYGGMFRYNDVTETHKKAYTEGTIGFVKYSDSYGSWLGGVAPIKNSKGKIVGVYECYMDASLLQERNMEFIKQSLLIILGFSFLFAIVFILYSYYELKPVRNLKKATVKVSEGNYDMYLDIKRNDEIGALAVGFNQMTGELKKYSEKMEALVEQRTEELGNKARELTDANEKLKEYSRTIEELSVTKERNRIARDLHDSVSQDLYGINLNLSTMDYMLENKPELVKNMLHKLQETVNKAQAEMRLMIYDLKPSDMYGKDFREAVCNLADMFSQRFSLVIDCNIRGEGSCDEGNIKNVLFRVIQEALSNIVRHSGAEKADISIILTEVYVEMTIKDDGKGFDISNLNLEGHYGIKGMKERVREAGGGLAVESAPGKGTAISVTIPI